MAMDLYNRTPKAARQPLCAVFEPRLPLLRLHELDATEEATVREHAAGCAWCQAQLSEYDDLRDALRRHYGADSGAVSQLMLEEITSADDDDDDDLAALATASRPPAPFAPRRQRPRLTAAAALAAALLLALLAGTIFRSHGVPSGTTAVPGVGTLAEFRLPAADSRARFIVAGRDGNLWFTENDRIGRITPRGVITEYPLPTGVILNGLAAGPDGNIWFTDGAGKIGRLSPRDGRVTEFSLPTRGMNPISIKAWNGNLWFKTFDGELGRITPEGSVTMVLVDRDRSVEDLAVGPDGDLWLVSSSVVSSVVGGDVIGRMSPTGVITWITSHFFSYQSLSVITGGLDGNQWFLALTNQVQLVRVTPQGVIMVLPVPTSANGQGGVILTGPDGNFWFVTGGDSLLGRITPQRVITTFALPASLPPFSMTLGPDGALWFTNESANTIDRIELDRSA